MADIRLPDITSRVRLDTDDVNHAVGRVGSSLKSMAGLIGGIGVGVAAGKFLKGAIDEAEEARKSIAQTNAVIASTGGVAKVSAADVDRLASSLSAKTGIDDEAIAAGENLLLTFTNVRNEVGKGNDIFNQGTKAALDMSVAMGTDMKSSSILVGKALNDPVKGVTALTKSGVQFTQQQKDQIKTLVESGRTLDAQKIILQELNTQFAGSAEAAASPMAKLKVAFGNLQEEVGTALMPTLSRMATFLAAQLPGAIDAGKRAVASIQKAIAPVVQFIRNAFAPGQLDVTWLDKLIGGARALIGAFKNASDGITSSGFAGTMERVGIAARGVFEFMREHAKPILIALGATLALTVAPLAAMAAALIYAYTHFQGFRDVVKTVVGFLTDTVIPAVSSFASFIGDQFGALAGWTRAHWASIEEAIGHVVSVVQAIIENFVAVIQQVWHAWGDELLNIARAAWDQIKNIVETTINVVRGIIETVVALINGDWGAAWDAIKATLAAAWDGIRETVVTALRVLREVVEGGVSAVVELFGSVPGHILDVLGDLGGLLYDAGRAIIRGFLNGIKDAVGAVYDFVSGIAGKIADLKGPIEKDRKLLIPAGQAIMDSLVAGLKNHEGDLVNQLARVTGLIQGIDTAGVATAAKATPASVPTTFSPGSYTGASSGSPAPPVVHTTIVIDRKVLAEATARGMYEEGRSR